MDKKIEKMEEREEKIRELYRYVKELKEVLGEKIKEGKVEKRTMMIKLYIEKEEIEKVLRYLKKSTISKMEMLVDMSAVDFPKERKRFILEYYLNSIRYGRRITIYTAIEEREILKGIESMTSLYGSAGWLEREMWDMYGIYYKNHPDLRRILTDYGFEGYPLRKDFPLTGYMEVRYDEEVKQVVLEPVELAQQYRRMKTEKVWQK